jgi:hypothetical protein
VIKKEAEKVLKYKHLKTETLGMRNGKASVIPVKIGVTGTISKSFRVYLTNIPTKHDMKKRHKTAVLVNTQHFGE